MNEVDGLVGVKGVLEKEWVGVLGWSLKGVGDGGG